MGLENTMTVFADGTGKMTVTMRHMPEENGSPTKYADNATSVAAAGFEALADYTDFAFSFTVLGR